MSNTHVALITGSGRGIGRAMALRFAAGGYRVALLARSENELQEVAREINDAGGQSIPVPCDITSWSAVQQAVERIQTELGSLAVLVNNAGSFSSIGPVIESDPEVWWRDVEINLRGPMHLCRAALPGMIENNSGVIINVSGGGAGNPFPFGSGYASSKAGLVRLTESLAAELKETGVVIFSLNPGLVRTRMTLLQSETEAGQKWIPSSQAAFDEGRDVPPELAAEMSFQIAQHSEELKPLSGRWIGANEKLDELLYSIPSILEANARMLRYSTVK